MSKLSKEWCKGRARFFVLKLSWALLMPVQIQSQRPVVLVIPNRQAVSPSIEFCPTVDLQILMRKLQRDSVDMRSQLSQEQSKRAYSSEI